METKEFHTENIKFQSNTLSELYKEICKYNVSKVKGKFYFKFNLGKDIILTDFKQIQ